MHLNPIWCVNLLVFIIITRCSSINSVYVHHDSTTIRLTFRPATTINNLLCYTHGLPITMTHIIHSLPIEPTAICAVQHTMTMSYSILSLPNIRSVCSLVNTLAVFGVFVSLPIIGLYILRQRSQQTSTLCWLPLHLLGHPTRFT